jgi:FAD synthase
MERGIEESLKVDIEKSAGPSTVILLTLEEENIERVKRIIKKPFRVWGRII